MDVGPAKVRRRATADVTRYEPVSLVMSRTVLATFDAFYTTTLKHGTLTFEWTHPRTGNTVDARMLAAPSYTPLAPRQNGTVDKWRVEFGVEIMPGTEVVADPPPPPPPPPEPGDAPHVHENNALGADTGEWLAYEDAGEYGVPTPADDPFVAVYEDSSGGAGDGGVIPSGDDGGGGFIEAPGSVGSTPIGDGSG